MKQSKSSLASSLRALPEAERTKILSRMRPEAVAALKHAWRFWARPEQLAPGTPGAASPCADWTFWLLLAGRGFGKTRASAEWVIEKARDMPGSHGALVAATADDARKTMLSAGLENVPGASGILAVSPPDFMPRYEPSKRTVTWPNATVATLYTAEEPDRLRGPAHAWAAVDEVAAWQHCQDAWDMLLMGLRLGENPQACITTTPRPIPLIKNLLADPRTVVTRGTTYDNRENLAPTFFQTVINRYEGTRLGRQELLAELLEDVPGALWSIAQLDDLRVDQPPVPLMRVVVAVDPAVTSAETSDETGIVVAGLGEDGHGYVLEDASGKHTPNEWAQRVVGLYHRHRADRVVAETNNGGDLVEVNLRTVSPGISYRKLTASRGKRTRAEPVAALFEQRRVHPCGRPSDLAKLEDEMTMWDPQDPRASSPSRMDAMVWAITDLMLSGQDASWSWGGSKVELASRGRGLAGMLPSNHQGVLQMDAAIELAREVGFDPFGLLELEEGTEGLMADLEDLKW